MARIAHVSRHLDSLISGIIGAAPFLDSGLRRNDDGERSSFMDTPAWMHACGDVGGRAASGTSDHKTTGFQPALE